MSLETKPGDVPTTAWLAWLRILAWVTDWLVLLLWLGLLTGLGLLLRTHTWELNPAAWQAIVAAATVAPATLWLAWHESRGRSPGKRAFSLVVVGPGGGTPRFARALVRNVVKVALPWQLGHLLAASFITMPADDPVPGWVILTSVAVYALMAVYVLALFVGSGRTPYDLASGTRVMRSPLPPGRA